MNEPLMDRLLSWVCGKIGHKLDINEAWSYNGIHCVCSRCGKTQSKVQNVD